MRLALVLVFAAAALAQGPSPFPIPVPAFPADLKNYLSLTDTQVQSILRINSDYVRTSAEKAAAMGRLQAQLAQELAKEQLDPMGIGLAYGSMELIRRQLADALKGAQAATVALLTDAQKAKLKTLDDAMKLQPLISQAVCENLLVPQPAPFPGNIIPVSRSGDFSSGTSSVVVGALTLTPCFVFSPVLTGTPAPAQP